MAMALAPKRKANRRQQLAFAERGCHETGGELRERQVARAARALHRDDGIQRRSHGDQLGGGIEVAERTAERAAVARLAVANLQHCLVQQRTARAKARVELEITLARHGADYQRLALLAYIGKLAHTVEIH